MSQKVFRLAPPRGAWTPDELEVLARIRLVLHEGGVPVEYEQGLTDEGAPWVTFFDQRDDTFVAHVTRDRGYYLLICSDRTKRRSSDMPALVDILRDNCRHDARATF